MNRAQQAAEIIADECVGVRLRMVHRVVNGIYDEALRPLGLRVGQLNLLVALTKRSDMTPTQLGRLLRIEKSTVSRDVDRMLDNGWLETTPSDDGRSHQLRVTAQGGRLLVAALPPWRDAQRKAQELLGKAACRSIADAAHSLWNHEQP